jgi:hypothetical protein
MPDGSYLFNEHFKPQIYSPDDEDNEPHHLEMKHSTPAGKVTNANENEGQTLTPQAPKSSAVIEQAAVKEVVTNKGNNHQIVDH